MAPARVRYRRFWGRGLKEKPILTSKAFSKGRDANLNGLTWSKSDRMTNPSKSR